MRKPSSLPILVQVAALAVLAVLLSQAVAFAVVVLSPDPRPPGFSIVAAADALQGRSAETTDGRPLRRRVDQRPVEPRPGFDPLSRAIGLTLAERLQVPAASVRVAIKPEDAPPGLRHRVLHPPQTQSFVFIPGEGASAATVTSETRVRLRGDTTEVIELTRAPRERAVRPAPGSRFAIAADRLSFAPFSASLRLDDGRWATVEPPRGLLSPWQQRILLGLAISLLLLSPLVWWMARRLTRPIRVFAEAAERLGADPEAEPLAPSGPSEVRTAISAFNDMQGKLRAHMRQRTQTVAAIAHDLRTPLTRLRFRAEQAPDPVRERMASDIEEMDALIGQAMAFVRGEAAAEARERFDLSGLAAACVEGYAETGADVRLVRREALPVLADPAAIRRAIGNLIGNAVKYAGSARVSLAREDGQALLRVEDDGPGLPLDELETLFEPFRRGEASRSRETGGAGPGLTIARQAARAAGGEVRLENRPEGGLVAALVLPLA